MTWLLTRLLTATALMFVASGAGAQTPQTESSSPPAQAQFGAPEQRLARAELDQLLAPIALYPDPLLSQVLIAATYPLEVVEASRWVEQNKGLKGNELKAGADQQRWDNG